MSEHETFMVKMPRFGAWLFYPLTKAAAFMYTAGWNLECHVVTIGPIGFAILWRKRRKDQGEGDE